ncbi:MAG: hypothetical protein QOC62_6798 [Mycobacterium sp.]|jgi:glyoxylase I family protein|nr:hypothetical protein [Mycobacterium sp.]
MTFAETLAIRGQRVTPGASAEREYGAVLTFKDPDGIQFEMFFKADHP